MILSQFEKKAVCRLIAENPPQDEWVHRHAERLGALFIGWDCSSCWFLRPSGKVVIVSEGTDLQDEHSDYITQLRALVWLSEQYPDLQSLRSNPVENAIDCESFQAVKISCPTCGGMGWRSVQKERQPVNC